MSKMVFDGAGNRYFHNGVSQVALFVMNGGAYGTGVPWNGVTNITKSADGGEPNALWADNIKYGTLMSAETAKGSIKAFTYPDEWKACDGEKELVANSGVYLGQQERAHFGIVWREEVGNDAGATDYIIHIMYNCVASPSERSNDTINDNADANEFSWDFEANPVEVDGFKPTATVELDSRKVASAKMTAILKKIYGDTSSQPTLPSIAELKTTLSGT